jgi:hypothetical protein
LKFHKKEFATPEREKRVSRYILIIAILTILPSIYLAYKIVQQSIFESNAQRFVKNEFHFIKTQVVTRNYKFDGKKPTIELLLFGEPLSGSQIDSIKRLMHNYSLDSTRLVIHQGLDARQKVDLSEIKASILEEVFSTEQKNDTLKPLPNKLVRPIPDIQKELKLLYPDLTYYTLQNTIVKNPDSFNTDTLTLFTGKFSKQISSKEKLKLGAWLKQRIQADTLKVIFE